MSSKDDRNNKTNNEGKRVSREEKIERLKKNLRCEYVVCKDKKKSIVIRIVEFEFRYINIKRTINLFKVVDSQIKK